MFPGCPWLSLHIHLSTIRAHLFHPPCSQLISQSLQVLVIHEADFHVADYYIPGIPETITVWKYFREGTVHGETLTSSWDPQWVSGLRGKRGRGAGTRV